MHREQSVKRENQQDATIRCLLLTSISSCSGHHYDHLQEIKEPVTVFSVLFWFCWMWLVAVVGRCVVGCEHCQCCSVEENKNPQTLSCVTPQNWNCFCCCIAVENYSKGKNVEEPLVRENIPIPELPSNFIWMQVSFCHSCLTDSLILGRQFKRNTLRHCAISTIFQLRLLENRGYTMGFPWVLNEPSWPWWIHR